MLAALLRPPASGEGKGFREEALQRAKLHDVFWTKLHGAQLQLFRKGQICQECERGSDKVSDMLYLTFRLPSGTLRHVSGVGFGCDASGTERGCGDLGACREPS